MDVSRYRWNGSELIDNSDAHPVPLYVADSFRLTNGQVVALDKHISRFVDSAHQQGLLRPFDGFLDAALAALPRSGDYFPRLDLTQRGELELHIRPTPALTDSLVLATAAQDPRTEPTIKGPDIPALNQLRDQALEAGASEALILDGQGRIVDGATTCLVWFDGQTLFTPPAEALRVASVTVEVVQTMARSRGYDVATAWATPAELAGTTLWALNALHGIRQVTGWLGGPELATDDEMLAQWRTDYQQLAAPLSEV